MSNNEEATVLFEENEELVNRIKSVSASQELDFEFLESVSLLSEHRHYRQGETILRQGDYNDYLFFLIDGRVGVYVEDERVSEMVNRGDLIGEMSVISQKPCSATIRAESEVQLIGVPTQRLDQLDPETAKRFSQTMDRIYATILVEKLTATNEKAKRFEATNRELSQARDHLKKMNETLERRVEERTHDLQRKSDELRLINQQLESQNTLLQTSFRKLEEFAGSKTMTFSKLSSLYHNVLVPLKKTISDLRTRMPEAPSVPAPGAKPEGRLHTLLDRASQETQSVVEILQPMTLLYSQERAMQSKHVLFIDGERKHQLIARLALGGTGVQLDLSSQVDEAKALMAGRAYEIIFLDAQLSAAAAELKAIQPEAHLVLMTSGQASSDIIQAGERRLFNTLISRDENDRTFTIKSIMTTAQKLINQDLFGLEKYLAWGVEVPSHPVERSDQRTLLLEVMGQYFQGMGLRSSLISRAQIVGEELLMNAIYDAPVDGSGKSLYNHLSRREVVTLKDRERATFRYACDGMLGALSVADPFGGFQSETLFRYLRSCYEGEPVHDRPGEVAHKGGAGRGLHQIVENSDLVIFNVKPKICTEVVALFNLDTSKSEHARGPSFHFFRT